MGNGAEACGLVSDLPASQESARQNRKSLMSHGLVCALMAHDRKLPTLMNLSKFDGRFGGVASTLCLLGEAGVWPAK